MTTIAATTPCAVYHADRSVVRGARPNTIDAKLANTVARSPNRPTSTDRINPEASAHVTLSGGGVMPEYWAVTNRTKAPQDSQGLRKRRWSMNATVKANMEAEIEYPANRMITPQATGGPKCEGHSGPTGIVSGIRGGPNQPAAKLSSRGSSAIRMPAASPTSTSRPTRGGRGGGRPGGASKRPTATASVAERSAPGRGTRP